jgi:hypothetical protein
MPHFDKVFVCTSSGGGGGGCGDGATVIVYRGSRMCSFVRCLVFSCFFVISFVSHLVGGWSCSTRSSIVRIRGSVEPFAVHNCRELCSEDVAHSELVMDPVHPRTYVPFRRRGGVVIRMLMENAVRRASTDHTLVTHLTSLAETSLPSFSVPKTAYLRGTLVLVPVCRSVVVRHKPVIHCGATIPGHLRDAQPEYVGIKG